VSSNLLELEQGLLASGSYNGDLNIWDIKRGTLKNKIKTSKWNLSIYAIVQLKNNLLATGGGGSYFISGIGTKFEETLNIWNISSFTLYCSFDSLLNQSHRDSVVRLASLYNGLLDSYSWDNTIKIWNVKNQSLLHTFTYINEISAIGVTSELVYLGKNLLANRYIKIYDVLMGKLVFKLDEALSGSFDYINELNLFEKSVDERFLVSVSGSLGSTTPGINIWNLSNRSLANRFNSFTGGLVSLVKSQTIVGKRWLLSGLENGIIKVWNISMI